MVFSLIPDNVAVIAYLHEHAGDLDWTITRPGLIKEEPSKGPVRITEAGGPSHFIDLARFTLELVQQDEQIHQCPYVGY